MKPITESNIEIFAIETLQSLGWEYVPGLSIAPGAENQERESFEQIILVERLRKAVGVLNPLIPEYAREQAVQKVLRIYSPDIIHSNETFHEYLVEKVKIPYQQDGFERSYEVALIDFENAFNNQFLVVNQYTIVENHQNKRPDLLLFINGIPLIVAELKNATDENATIEKAYDQLRTYKATISSLFTYNTFCVISDGHVAKAGTLSAGISRYMVWKSADGVKDASRFRPQLETLLVGMLNHATVLDLIRNFIVFEKTKREDPKTGLTQIVTEKKLAAYHQYFAVNRAVESTVQASGEKGNKKGGVVWHTQGSGKSLSMLFYAGKLITSPEMQNPTILVITDRNDLDEQLFGVFAASRQLLRQDPVQAESRTHLKELLKVSSGGIVFTTIQKFLPEEGKAEYDRLSERKNIVVIADEAHRTQYGFEAVMKEVKDKETKEVIGQRIAYGLAKYMRDALPNATYIGFTGTPIESTDVNTPQVFGQYIDIYDISQAVNDGATVKIYYESRLAKVYLNEEGKRLIEEFDKELEQEELTEKQKAKAKWSKLEAIIGHPERLKNLAKDIVAHFEARQTVFIGKAMIVTMSRRIAVELYREIIALRPEWHHDDLSKGMIKVVMTASSSDGPEMEKHHTTKEERNTLADRMKDEADELKLVIVRDMWLTGFDAPCLKTLYIDKPMHGHNLMQAIARVNRIFKDVKGGLVVDYLGIATDLKKALSFYSDAGGKGFPTENIDKAIEVMKEKIEIVQQMFNEDSETRSDILMEEPEAYYSNSFRFNYRRFFKADANEKLSIILQAEEHILGLPQGKERFINETTLLSQAFALAIPDEEAMKIKDEIAFFQAVKARLVKFEGTGAGKSDIEIETAIKQMVDEAIASDKVIDIFDAAGIKKPDISILSDEFLMEVKGLKHQNLALELLKRILNDEIKSRTKTNLVKSKALLEMLERAIKKYQNNLLTTAEIIQELINLAKDVREADKEGEKLGLSTDEVAFYNALETNDSAVKVLGDETLKDIAREIADKVRANATIDWTIRESARAKLMVLVRRTLTKYGYPPDKQPKAIETVMKQAEAMANYWTNE
ncbi:type I restriction endonuclease subunit R [Terrimonas pollutisoli]|uniref:type I restriction endonuclease subunit R n=1 Tax=Terrimonas pollutisoli TaxID=3034147 RepID=UPI0023EC9ECC|nr:type I restriction endonuclease subunit R [Terrimonas sp. H1YJ31]